MPLGSPMTQDELKQAVAREAIKHVVDDAWIGVGSGSTANFFIDELAKIKGRIKGAVASSVKTAERLKSHGIPVDELNNAGRPAGLHRRRRRSHRARRDDQGRRRRAHPREDRRGRVEASSCASSTKPSSCRCSGKFPLPVEVIPMARSYVARELVKLGGQPAWRMGFTTDNGNVILDVRGLSIVDPVELETTLNQIAGVVTVGLFARRGANVILIGTRAGVKTLVPGRP